MIHSLSAAVGVKRASGTFTSSCLLPIHHVSVEKTVLVDCRLW